jgi:nucleoside-triphosphatase THEP1
LTHPRRQSRHRRHGAIKQRRSGTQAAPLLEGRPGIGKTTVVRRLVRVLQEVRASVGGFTTRALRSHDRRVGFVVEALDGPEAVIAQ